MDARIGLPQDAETKPRTIECGEWTYRYGYIRSSDCRSSGDAGQDYLAFADKGGTLAFALCDGVGMSYYGDIAAKFVGEKLLDWLSREEDALADRMDDIRDSLERTLQEMAIEGRELVARHRLPAALPEMLRDVLESKKKRGSATVFACGRLDPPCDRFPGGRLLLAWMGDVRIRAWGKQGELTFRATGTVDTRHQWNSSAGPTGGGPWIHTDDGLGDAGRYRELLVYTDGLAALDEFGSIDTQTLDHVVDREARNPSGDDLSFMHVRWAFNLERGAGSA